MGTKSFDGFVKIIISQSSFFFPSSRSNPKVIIETRARPSKTSVSTPEFPFGSTATVELGEIHVHVIAVNQLQIL